MLTPKERLIKSLQTEKVDRPPCICPGGMMNMIIKDVMKITGAKWPEAHLDSKLMAELTEGMYENGAFENFGVPFCMTVEAESLGAKVFMGTEITEPRVIEYPINSVNEWKTLNNIDINQGRTKVVLDAIKILKEKNKDVPVIANLTGPVSLASSLVDPIEYYKALRKKPKEVHEFMEFVAENLIAFGKAQLEAGADILTISDPSGTGEILGPKMFSECAIPYLNKILLNLKPFAKGGTIVHICGRLKSVYEQLNELHSDAISIDSLSSIKDVIDNVNNKVIMGNVSTLALEKNSAESVAIITKVCIKNGASIIAPACGIGARTPLNNIQAMVNSAKDYK